MSFLTPLWFAAAAAGVLGVIALHLITTQRPPPATLPTARFVPPGDARASSRAARPTDVWLLVLRCLALLLLGAAFAGPVTRSRGSSLARVFVVDRSRGALADARDSAAALLKDGDAVVLLDSAATIVTRGAADSLRALATVRARGSLSAGLVGARRAARDLAQTADSVELVIISPLTADEIDAASAEAANRWPGRVRLVRTSSAPRVGSAITLVSGEPDDALRPAIAALSVRAGRGVTAEAVRVVRAFPNASDSAAARAGTAIVFWPRAGTASPAAQGLWAGSATLVAPLERLAVPQPVAGSRTIARWADGAPAAVETALRRGCMRIVGVGVPSAGDITLQPAFVAVAQSLLAPCGDANSSVPASDSVAQLFARNGPAAAAGSLRSTDESSPLAPWILAAALLLLAGELFVRRGAMAVTA